MADFPAAKYSGVTVTDNATDVLATHHNTQDAELVAIEAELGTDPAGSLTDVKTRLAVMMADDGTLEFADSTVLTISSGAITVTQNYHRIATEGGAGSDLLATINGLANDGAVLFLRPSTANDIILDTGADNITCRDGADITLADTNDIAVLVYDANLTTWIAGVFAGGGVLTTSTGAADSYIAVYTAAGNIEGTDDFQWDGTTFTIGDGTAARDYIITINGETNNFVATWMEDEDYLLLADSLFMSGAARIYFSEAGGNIYAPANNYIYIEADTQVALRAGQIWLGSQKAGQDIELLFYGENSSGIITWMEDEDRFQISDDIMMVTNEKILLRDTALGIYSQADTFIDVFADGGVRVGDSSAGAPTNYANFAPDGELTLVGTARVNKELYVPLGSLGTGATKPDSVSLGNYTGWSYDIGDDSVFDFHMPHGWDPSTDMTVHIIWYINEAYATNSGEVQWQIAWSAMPCDATEAVDAPTHTGTIDFGDQNIPATAKFLTSITGTIAAASLADEDTVGLTLSRVALDGGANPTADPVIIDIHIDYVANKIGEAT